MNPQLRLYSWTDVGKGCDGIAVRNFNRLKQLRARVLQAISSSTPSKYSVEGDDENQTSLPRDDFYDDMLVPPTAAVVGSATASPSLGGFPDTVILYGAGRQTGVCPLIPFRIGEALCHVLNTQQGTGVDETGTSSIVFELLSSPSLSFALIRLHCKGGSQDEQKARRSAAAGCDEKISGRRSVKTALSALTIENVFSRWVPDESVHQCNACTAENGSGSVRRSSSTATGKRSASDPSTAVCQLEFAFDFASAVISQDLFRRYSRPYVMPTSLAAIEARQRNTPPVDGKCTPPFQKSTAEFRTLQSLLQPNRGTLLSLPYLPGLFVLSDIVSLEEETAALLELGVTPQSQMTNPDGDRPSAGNLHFPVTPSWELVNGRQVCHFGKRFLYGSNSAGESTSPPPQHPQQQQQQPPVVPPLPPLCELLKSRLLARWKETASGDGDRDREDHEIAHVERCISELDQCTINRYPVGTGIPAHVDHPTNFGEWIVSVSLASDTVMEFSPVEAPAATPGQENRTSASSSQSWSIPLARRSAVVLTGESRYHWTHVIPARRVDHLLVNEMVADGGREGEGRGRGSISSRMHTCAVIGVQRQERLSLTLRGAVKPNRTSES
jgi:hypothetical protein